MWQCKHKTADIIGNVPYKTWNKEKLMIINIEKADLVINIEMLNWPCQTSKY